MPARLAQALEDLDTSRDGEIDAAEWEAAIETALANKLKTLGSVREAKLLSGGGTGLPLFLFGDLSGLNGAGLQRSSSKKKKVSGAGARLCAAIEDERNKCDGEPLVLFTGNSFGSSFEGTVTKGDHLVPTLNSLGTYAGGVGAKDLEFGVQNLERLAASLNFPLLLSNVVDARTGEPLKGTQASRIVHWSGRKVGLMAVASEASLAITGTVECVSGTGYAPGKGFSTQVRVEPEARSIQRVGAELRQKGAEVIICLAAIGGGHGPGDRGAVLAQGGGADVVIVSGPPGPRGGALGATKYEVGNGRSSWCVRAPTNLSCLGKFTLSLADPGRMPTHASLTAVACAPGSRAIDSVGRLAVVAHRAVAKALTAPAATLDCVFDASAEALRGGRNIAAGRRMAAGSAAEMAADLVCAATRSDLCILDGRALRSIGEVPAKKPMSYGELLALSPYGEDVRTHVEPGPIRIENDRNGGAEYVDPFANSADDDVAAAACAGEGLIIVEATGLQIRVALELALARFPSLSDDFPHISSSLQLSFDPQQRPGRRIKKEGMVFAGRPMLRSRTYRLVTTARFARRALLGSKCPHGASKVCVPACEGPHIVTLLRNLFSDLANHVPANREFTCALAESVHTKLRKTILKPKKGGYVVASQTAARIVADDGAEEKERKSPTRLPDLSPPTSATMPYAPAPTRTLVALPPPVGPRTPKPVKTSYYAQPLTAPRSPSPQRRGYQATDLLAPLEPLNASLNASGLENRGSPVRLVGGLGNYLRDPIGLPDGIDSLSASTSATVWNSTTGLGGSDQTSEFSSSIKSKSIRLIFGRIDCSRRVLEAQRKSMVQIVRLRAH